MAATLAEPRIQRFLGTKEVIVLATIQRDGSPLAMPMWFWHDPAAITMISVADTQKVRNLGGREMPPNRVMFRITPTHVTDWGLA